jgi:FtsP/CotA-like multicopper oxidase with cupredoxin domain
MTTWRAHSPPTALCRLKTVVLALLSVFAACAATTVDDPLGAARTPAHGASPPSSDTLRAPPALENLSSAPGTVEVSLTARPAVLPLVPGRETEAWAYEGSVPGPTLEVQEGDRVVIRFRNELPEATTVHWHGLHVPFASDGSPFHPVAPGEEYEYAFMIPPGSAGTYWYHPHPHHRTAWQVGMGLFGAIVVRAPDDPLPASLPEKLLVLADNRFLPDGSLDFPDPASPQGRVDERNGREGDVLFVNGQVLPQLPIRSGEVQRWRVINASGARIYRLALPGHTFLHVGSDGGLFEHPVEVDEIVLANGERAELLVRGSQPPGSRSALQALPYDRYMPLTRPDDWERTHDLLALQYTDDPPAEPAALPDRLRRVTPLDPADASATRVMRMSQGRINSRIMDPERVDVSAPLGATEIWEVENMVGMDHPFHLHGFQFQVLSRNGVPEPFRSWKDTVNVPARERVRFIVRYADHPGKWMFHCHILDHEDQGMMGVLEVR